ncbi:Zn-ribbon domain-containing OB-fold protein [Streptomyces sp. NPDC016845]|uniref:Zn-ribbon domain-containing OB-fold protein n=1 Tax=Streptomyces sp. NPDC016845 TaxID=3364972 RepID=UPI003798CBAE
MSATTGMSRAGGSGVLTPADGAGAEPTGFVHQRCRWCGTASFRRLLCPVCASSELTPQVSVGPGIVVQSRVVHRGSGVARNEALVRFPEDFVVPCRIVGTAPHMVWVGAEVRPARGIHAGVHAGAESGEVLFELCEPAGGDDLR